jgi:glycosyltransferase involved in cell wall biosynthesis
VEPGVNLIGYARAEFGLGEACRLAARALETAGIPFGIINFPFCPARQNDLSWKHMEIPNLIYNTNLFFINADQLNLQFRVNRIKKEWFYKRYNIGYWHWELPEFPNKWIESFNLIDEVWVPSTFTLNSIAKKTTIPVIKIPHLISIHLPLECNRGYFGLPKERFLFLTMADLNSTAERKNPAGVIKAFKQAFKKDDLSVGLVLKLNNPSNLTKEVEKLKREIDDYKNIFLLDVIYNRDELNLLIQSIDCFVSLHRAEGFGLQMAEAMFLEKPVIATNWSGNTDYMNKENSYLVDVTLKNVIENVGPYSENQRWAEPNLKQATTFMKKIVENQSHAREIGRSAKKTIQLHYSPMEISKLYRARFSQLGTI